MENLSINTIAKIMRFNRGGHEDTSKHQLLAIWNILPEDTQKEYIEKYDKSNPDDDKKKKTKKE